MDTTGPLFYIGAVRPPHASKNRRKSGMARRSLIAIMLLGFIGAVAVPAAQAFECPTRQKEARQFLNKARAASRQVTGPA